MPPVGANPKQLSIESYLEVLQKSNLATKETLVQTINAFREATRDTPELRKNPLALSRYLIKAKVITVWQNSMLLEGRHKGFFLGKYKLLDHLGTGGMSTVYLGEHAQMKRRVALKVLHPARKDEKTFLQRFLREAQAIASLDHQNVVKVFDVDNDGKVYYMAMEYIEGIDLQRRIEKKGPLNFPTAAHCIRQAADGLGHAHDRKLIHRDVKPANLLVDKTNTLKILDLGLVQLTNSNERSLTVEHNEKVLGTADYLAPEQAIDSHKVDARADIYALGCTLYFLVTGSPPFPDGTVLERLVKHQTAKPKSIYDFCPHAPPAVVEIFERMTAKQPADRYATVHEVSADLRAWLKNPKAVSVQGTSEAELAKAKGVTKPGAANSTGKNGAATAGKNGAASKPPVQAPPRPQDEQPAEFDYHPGESTDDFADVREQLVFPSNDAPPVYDASGQPPPIARKNKNGDGQLNEFLHTVSLSADEVSNMYSAAGRRSSGEPTSNLQMMLTILLGAVAIGAVLTVVMLMQG